MSASLVGSEMCIRDRTRPAAASTEVGPAGPAGCTARTSLWWDEGRATSPVSYTHLTLPTICSV
eukprot:7091956-Alexandrium_andersonii.AAC.1